MSVRKEPSLLRQDSSLSENAALSSHSPNYEALSVVDDDEQDDGVLVVSSRTDNHKLVGRLLLFVVAFLYGTLNVSLRLVYAKPDPPSASALSTVRGWLAVVCFAPFLLQKRGERHQEEGTRQIVPQQEEGSGGGRRRRPLWLLSLELACWNFGAQGLVNVGLLWIASARASFLTETSVIITPVISFLAGHPVKWTVWLACIVAICGLAILSDNDGLVGHFSLGDIMTLMGAVCWSTYIFRLSSCGDYDEVDMQALKNIFLASLYSIWFAISSFLSDKPLWPGYANVAAWLLLFYSALGPGTVADVIQQKGQASVEASEANVIMALEPVFTSILGFLLLGEAMTTQEYLGGLMLIIAAILATR